MDAIVCIGLNTALTALWANCQKKKLKAELNLLPILTTRGQTILLNIYIIYVSRFLFAICML